MPVLSIDDSVSIFHNSRKSPTKPMEKTSFKPPASTRSNRNNPMNSGSGRIAAPLTSEQVELESLRAQVKVL